MRFRSTTQPPEQSGNPRKRDNRFITWVQGTAGKDFHRYLLPIRARGKHIYAYLPIDRKSLAVYTATMAPKVRQVINVPVGEHRGRHTGAGKRAIKLKLENPQLSDAKIAARVGCSAANVHNVLSKFLGDHTETELREFQESKANIFDALQLRTLMSITNEDIAKAPLLPRITGAAILEDKARLIRGQATQINVSVLLDAVAAIREQRHRD